MSNGTNRSGRGGGGGIGAMLGAGGTGGINVAGVNVMNPANANQAPTPQNVPVNPNALANLKQMSDAQLAQLVRQSQNVQMPNHLSDAKGSTNATQKFVYMAGLNQKPMVLDDTQFNAYLKQNNIPKSDILARSTGGANYTVNGTNIRLSPNQVVDMVKYGDLNYVGGKHGGMVYGAGTYFDRNGGVPTGYGGTTFIGVLNPNTASVIDRASLRTASQSFARSHPQFASAVGSFDSTNMSIYALAQGYNVITDGMNSYHNVIDRSALVLRDRNY